MQDPAMTPAETPASSMDQLRQQDTDINVDVNVTPINIMTSKNLSKEYRELLKVLDKKNRKEGTCNLLKMCIKKQVIPRTFDLGNVELYDNLCNESKARWDATTFFRIEISLEHHLRSLENLNKTYKNAKKCLFTKLLQFERDIIENTLRDKIRRAQKFFERKHNRKINHLSRNAQADTDTQSSSFSDTQASSDTQSSSQSSDSSSQASESQTQTNSHSNTADELLLQESEENNSDTDNDTLEEINSPPDNTNESTSQQSNTDNDTENSGTDFGGDSVYWVSVHLHSRDLHLSHYMKFRYTMKGCT